MVDVLVIRIHSLISKGLSGLFWYDGSEMYWLGVGDFSGCFDAGSLASRPPVRSACVAG